MLEFNLRQQLSGDELEKFKHKIVKGQEAAKRGEKTPSRNKTKEEPAGLAGGSYYAPIRLSLPAKTPKWRTTI